MFEYAIPTKKELRRDAAYRCVGGVILLVVGVCLMIGIMPDRDTFESVSFSNNVIAIIFAIAPPISSAIFLMLSIWAYALPLESPDHSLLECLEGLEKVMEGNTNYKAFKDYLSRVVKVRGGLYLSCNEMCTLARDVYLCTGADRLKKITS